MPRADVKARSLSIFLLKPDFASPDRALFHAGPLTECRVALGGQFLGDLFIKPTSDRVPSWLSLFDGSLNLVPEGVRNASSAAVFLVGTGGRSFAVTFGYGRSLLRPGAWEEDFGLKVTLNAVDPLKIRSVDRVKFDAISQHSQIQASRDANIVEFGLDVEQDILRAVTGKSRDASLASQLTGKDALKADVRVNLGSLPGLLGRFLDVFGQDVYRERFSWVDQVGELRDPTRVSQLDGMLVQKLRDHDFDRLWLAIPDRVEWEGMAGFKYRDSHKAIVHPDVDLRTFLEEQGEHFLPAIDILKNRRRVYLISYEADAVTATWSVYRCIYCEVDVDGETFLLNNGKWYRVSTDFLRDVNDSFARVLSDTLTLPEFSHADEAAYSRSVAEGAPDTFCLMDRQFPRFPATRDQIEFCDLYSRAKQMIHVKRYRGSATLSHLFSQGVVSAELFCSVREFREAVNEHLPEGYRLMDVARRPNSEEFEVVFAIVSKSRNPLKLPFFSRVNLKNAAHRLRAFGYKASVTKVQASVPGEDL